MVKVPNPDTVSEEAKIAKALGVELDDSDAGKDEKESDSSKKTDTEVAEEERRSDESEKSEEKVDYKEKYSASTKEVQEKYLPMEKQVKKLEDLSGKSLEELLKGVESTDKSEDTKKDTSTEEAEVGAKNLSVEEDVQEMKEKLSELTNAAMIAAKEKVESFLGKYDLSKDYYNKEIAPKLDAVKQLQKENGDPYSLEEGLETAYLLANKSNVEKVIEKKVEIAKREESLGGFSPQGAKTSSSVETPEFSAAQLEVARRLRVDLTKKEESK